MILTKSSLLEQRRAQPTVQYVSGVLVGKLIPHQFSDRPGHVNNLQLLTASINVQPVKENEQLMIYCS